MDRAALLAWYDRHRRDLPWRAAPGVRADPYHVWLSEIMLQQTTVATVGPYFRKFIARFPSVHDLAAAEEGEVLALWAGLGYYARARNLHACARAVAAGGGAFPSEEAGLRGLPGVGAYTAAAIAAIAFGENAVPIDGNVERVVSRLFAIDEPLPAGRKAIAAAAEGLKGNGHRPGDFAQALFDLGATICTPTSPACALCPWSGGCAARRAGRQGELPVKPAKKARPTRHGAAFVLTDAAGRVLLRRRAAKGLLGGMTEVPGTAWRAAAWGTAEAVAEAPMAADWRLAGRVSHVFTHFALELDVYAAVVPVVGVEGFLRERAALAGEALPTVMRKCLAVAGLG